MVTDNLTFGQSPALRTTRHLNRQAERTPESNKLVLKKSRENNEHGGEETSQHRSVLTYGYWTRTKDKLPWSKSITDWVNRCCFSSEKNKAPQKIFHKKRLVLPVWSCNTLPSALWDMRWWGGGVAPVAKLMGRGEQSRLMELPTQFIEG